MVVETNPKTLACRLLVTCNEGTAISTVLCSAECGVHVTAPVPVKWREVRPEGAPVTTVIGVVVGMASTPPAPATIGPVLTKLVLLRVSVGFESN
jgi:hypothetical protein